MEENVVLVNEQNEPIGLMPKMEAHRLGVLHRAISVLLYNSHGDMLIQQRAASKYHWPLIWSNACCTHPRENEEFIACASRRIEEELGIKVVLEEIHRFIYRAEDKQTGMIEYEYDVVYQGIYDGEIRYNSEEIEAIRWVSIHELETEIEKNPDNYSFWFREILKKISN